MQKVFLRLFLLSLSVCMFSCQSNRQEDDVDILEPTGGTGKTYTMYLDATYPSFVGDEADGTTRAQNNSWENGDVIYISFTDGNTHKIGEGKYNSSTGKWTVKLDNGSLSEGGLYPCSVYYLCDGTVSRTGDAISIDECTAVYADMYANYSVTQDEIVLSASLRSQTWRMAFKGEVGTEVTVQPESSIQYVNQIDMSRTGSSSIQYSNDKAIDLTVQSTGKTPYIYGVFDSKSYETISLSLLVSHFPNLQFTRSISPESLNTGESGVIEIPNSSDSSGLWISKERTAKMVTGREFNAIIKTLSSGITHTTEICEFDEYVEHIKFVNNSPLSDGVILSASDSDVNIYATFESTTGTIVISTPANSIQLSSDCSKFFCNFNVLKDIVGINILDTREVTNMRFMFSQCDSLKLLDLSSFNTQKLTYMYEMFSGCSSLESIELGSFNTENVGGYEMTSLFLQCHSLKSLDLSSFDTKNVTTFYYMFSDCESLESLILGSFDTSNVESMDYMFNHCHSLKYLDLRHFNTERLVNIQGMFEDCTALEEIHIDNWRSPVLTDLAGMFMGCSKLKHIDMSSLDTSKVDSFRRLFFRCTSLKSVNLNNICSQNVTDFGEMFIGCSSLAYLDISNFDTKNATDMYGMFDGCSSLKTLNLNGFDTHNVINMYHMFQECSSLETLDLGRGFVINDETEKEKMCRGLASSSSACTISCISETKAALLDNTRLDESKVVWNILDK